MITKFDLNQVLYNHGDMANLPGWYKITEIKIDSWGINYKIEEINGERQSWIPEVYIHDIDKGNGSTRIVTKEAKEKLDEEKKLKLKALYAKYNK